MSEPSMKRAPKVSVIMTIYNAAPYLKEAIDSVVAQTFPDWELIAVENGSSDRSPEILAGYKDKRVRAFTLPKNIGRTPALRYVFERAEGEYIAVLDADDISHCERLKKQAEYLDQHPEVGLVGSWGDQINERGEVIGRFEPSIRQEDLYEALGWWNPIVHSSVMYRTKYAQQLGGYPESYVYAQDFALILAIARMSRLSIIGEPLCQYRVISSNMTRNPRMLLRIGQEQLALLQEAAETFSLSERTEKRNHQRQAVAHLKIGIALVKELKIIDGLKNIAAGMMKDPKSLIRNGVVSRMVSMGGISKWG